ncbi:hypothetical protein [Bradyrhizobium sp. 27S5]|uniref:hypothetical protein n=1 Tax=Bradyrhizobium sp. 27S5 TaxID=3139728 RepID=UPI0030CF76B0
MKLLDQHVSLQQGHYSRLNLPCQCLAQGVLPIEEFGKRKQRPYELRRPMTQDALASACAI